MNKYRIGGTVQVRAFVRKMRRAGIPVEHVAIWWGITPDEVLTWTTKPKPPHWTW